MCVCVCVCVYTCVCVCVVLEYVYPRVLECDIHLEWAEDQSRSVSVVIVIADQLVVLL